MINASHMHAYMFELKIVLEKKYTIIPYKEKTHTVKS